jgi:pyridoxal phosphate enzyme (YggS family)
MSIKEAYIRLRKEVPSYVTIILAAKTRTKEEVLEALTAGATDIGYNYVQEAETMYAALGEHAKRIRWHMIGHLQTNKINKALQIFDVIQTVDSLEKAIAINVRAERIGKKIAIYFEINSGNELSKSGLPPDYNTVYTLAQEVSKLNNIRLEGLMTMGPSSEVPEIMRPYLHKTKEIFDQLKSQQLHNISLNTLSMGMSSSYKTAIEEGSTMIRLGTIVFGQRNYK